jgi:hypothetical protein
MYRELRARRAATNKAENGLIDEDNEVILDIPPDAQ